MDGWEIMEDGGKRIVDGGERTVDGGGFRGGMRHNNYVGVLLFLYFAQTYTSTIPKYSFLCLGNTLSG